jgi:hypothetical protein
MVPFARGWPLVFAFVLAAPRPAAAASEEFNPTFDKKKAAEGASAMASAQGQSQAALFDCVTGSTPKPEQPLRKNLLVPDPDEPDAPPTSDKSGVTLGLAFYDKQKLIIEWDNGPYAGSAENRTIAFYPSKIKIRYRLRQEVAVSEQYAVDSCPYKATFAHELTHWAANEEIYQKSLPELGPLLEALRADGPQGAPGAPISIDELEKKFERFQAVLDKRVEKHGYDSGPDTIKELADGIKANGLNFIASSDKPVYLKADSDVVARYQKIVGLALTDEPPPKERCRKGVLCYFKNVVSARMAADAQFKDSKYYQGESGGVYSACKGEEWDPKLKVKF